ncbi:MAG: tripartite tricarboxylate transporter substrate binding protein [Betaproteobacteria bacterium]|nr:tripartite tricarboxylate transporter substrate binding protein [Betaproteobacteria bacterium]
MAKFLNALAVLLSGVLAAASGGTALGQAFPGKPIELISPTSAGSGTDIYARMLADIVRREKLLPQPMVVQNRTGGGSLIAYNYFQTRRGDPYTMMAATGTVAIMAARADVNIGLENYTPLALFAVDPQAIMVGVDSPYKTLRDLVEAARKAPDTIVGAITNPLGSGREVIHMLEKFAPGAKFKFVTFKGGGEAVLSVAGGHTHFTTENLSEGLPLLEAKKLRALAVTSLRRMSQLPDLPTVAEVGYKFDAGTLRGFVYTVGVPKEIAAMMEKVLERAHKSSAWQEHARRHFYEDRYLASPEYAKLLAQRVEHYRAFFQEIGAFAKP